MKVFAVIPALLVLVSLCGSPVPPPPGTVTGSVFFDANRNGIRDSCDLPMLRTKVVVTASDGKQVTAETDESGVFTVSDAPVGDDQVALVAAEGYLWPITTESAAAGVRVESSKTVGGIEFGSASRSVYPAAETVITGILFNDENGNGNVDRDECGLAEARQSLTVELGARNGVIGEDGSFEIRNYAGEIGMVTAGPNPWGDARKPPLVATAATSERDPCSAAITPRVRYGKSVYEANIGFTDRNHFGTGTIAGTVFNDVNRNGARDVDEPAVPNVRLDISPRHPSCVTRSTGMSVVTDANGQFLLGSIPPGEYQATVSTFGLDYTAPIVEILSSAKVTVVEGPLVEWDVAVATTLPAEIAVYAFDDANGNGLWDEGEPAVPGLQFCVTPGAYGPAESPGEVPFPVGDGLVPHCLATDLEGRGTVTYLAAGEYYVQFAGVVSAAIGQLIAPQLVTLASGESITVTFAVEVITSAEQVILPADGIVLPLDICFSDPAWAQPSFDAGDYSELPIGFGEDVQRLIYEHHIYQAGYSAENSTWASLAGLDWPSGIPPECQMGSVSGTPFNLVNYEPVEQVVEGGVVQVKLVRREAGLYSAVLPYPQHTDLGIWYLFVDENYVPIVRCTPMFYGCEWNDGTAPPYGEGGLINGIPAH